MQQYNPKDWFGLIFKFHKSDTFRKLFWVMLSLAVYSVIVIYLELEVLKVEFSSTVMHSLLGFIISLLLVFRTNTAYDRWWEGRKQWGALVNVCRNILLKTYASKASESSKSRLKTFVITYPDVLKEHLRNTSHEHKIELLPEIIGNRSMTHIPNNIAFHMQLEIEKMKAETPLSESAYLALLNDCSTFTNICGACERIRKTPIPYTYNIFIKKFIFVYIITMPLGFAGQFQYWTILITVFTFYTLASLELIAEEIEDPFGLDSDDLPTNELTATIELSADEISKIAS